ncbi:MAG: TonB-dependent receptor [Bacteroidales bacterium]|nr:TonB-dependent receptor [Bacteroidales bacterium]
MRNITTIKTLVLLAGLMLWGFFPSAALAQSFDISGTVVDETDLPLPGAMVIVKGETRGSMTDAVGRFSLPGVSAGDVLVVSFLGYQDEEVKVGSSKDILVKLVPQENMLEEVVKVAYGTQRKASVIGSIASIDMEQLKVPVGQLSSTLAGKLAGIVVVQSTGEPGAGADFWIRGMNTFGANSKPLVLVDGVERDMDLVDSEDIASFSILKDATATALYGVRGANGVVLITTKRGSESKPKISFKAESGLVSPTRLPELANPDEWINYYNGLYTSTGAEAPIGDYERQMYLSGKDPELYPTTDWIHTIFKEQSTSSRVNLSVTGGTKTLRYYVGGNYYFEDGIFNTNQDRYDAGMSFDKFSFRSNVDIDISKSTTIGLSLSNQFTDTNSPRNDRNEIYARTLAASPVGIVTVYDDGTLTLPEQGYNPWNLLNSLGYRTIKNNVAQATLSLTQDFSDIITEGLKADIKFSWDAQNQTIVYRSISPAYSRATGRDDEGKLIYEAISGGNNYMTLSSSNSGWNKMNLEAALNYERTFATLHRVSGMFLFSMRNRTNNVPGSSYIGAFPYKTMGVAGRATYSYADRYFAEFNFGYNGSENFAPGHRLGFFPSFALGYMVSNEPWWDGLKDVVSMLKFKASYGKVGSDEIGGSRRFAYNTTINTSAAGAMFGDTPTNKGGITTGDYGNPEVSWEEATKSNAGFELTLFKDLRFVFDYFYDRRDGIFIERQSTPSAVGINVNQYVNIGKMKNQGYDMTLEYDHTFSGGLFVSARANYSFNRNKILYNDQPDQVWKYQNTAGFAFQQQRGLIAEGLFESEDEIAAWPTQKYGKVQPGDIKYRDINNDGVVDNYDKVAIGYTIVPEINYGFGVSLGWKGIDASVFFSGVGHVTRIISGNNLFGATADIKYEGQIFADVARNRWTPDNPDTNAPYPRLSLENVTNNQQASTYWQRDMSFLRLKNAEIGYTLPKNISGKIGLSTTRIYIQGVNLLTFSKFKLWDPELATSNGSAYPNIKSYSIGVNLNF